MKKAEPKSPEQATAQAMARAERGGFATLKGLVSANHWPEIGRLAGSKLQSVRDAVAVRVAQDASQTLASWPLIALLGLPAGILVYFRMPIEPPIWIGGLMLALLGLVWMAWRPKAPAWRMVFVALSLFALALSLASYRTASVAQPGLTFPIYHKLVTGKILAIVPADGHDRVFLSPSEIEGFGDRPLPHQLRIKVDLGHALAVGQVVQAKVFAMPPSEPLRPGGLDMQRLAYFSQIGGYGAFRTEPQILEAGQGAKALQSYRTRISGHLIDSFEGATGQIMGALLVGTKQGIPEPVVEAIRASGLSHLLAISGLHVGLVAGMIFFMARYVFLFLGLALRLRPATTAHSKKAAALVTILAALVYLGISGASLPTQRAFWMLSLGLLAVTLNRRAFSPRLVALAAVVILVVRPESLITPSFQLSFAAVIALIAFGSLWQVIWRPPNADRPLTQKLSLTLMGLASTSFLATLATAPFVLATFNQVSLSGLLANMLAVPLMGIWILPWGLVGLIFEPLGLGFLGFVPMSWGVDFLVQWALFWHAFDWGLLKLASPQGYWLALTALGLWLALVSVGLFRAAAAGLIMLSLMGLARPPMPLVLVSGGKGSVGLVTEQGLVVIGEKPGNFASDLWQQSLGGPQVFSLKEAQARGILSCDQDQQACLYKGKKTVAIARAWEAALEDCALADLVILPDIKVDTCAAQHWDYSAHAEQGSVAVYAAGSEFRFETVKNWRGDRPWSR